MNPVTFAILLTVIVAIVFIVLIYFLSTSSDILYGILAVLLGGSIAYFHWKITSTPARVERPQPQRIHLHDDRDPYRDALNASALPSAETSSSDSAATLTHRNASTTIYARPSAAAANNDVQPTRAGEPIPGAQRQPSIPSAAAASVGSQSFRGSSSSGDSRAPGRQQLNVSFPAVTSFQPRPEG
jgi:hypothetical protein